MRHGNRLNRLSRTSSHRHALMMNLGNALVEHKQIITTTAKAKALRTYIEPIITKSKTNTTHNRRLVFSKLRDKESIKTLFDTVGPKVATRNGGYTRIIKIGFRPGDNADMALIELVDFSLSTGTDVATTTTETAVAKKRTRRAGGAKKADGAKGTDAKATSKKVTKPTTTKANTPKIRQRKSGGA